ncbi:2-oxo-4-hydroxy-4-carboxy-5-ureidoimidazoline decarboxylase [Acinetobacter kanungonis]|uniref:2-oxo-4-hydroxy-4-carboxy-5-ureidoimidazoline decarboxylase n=1 Tax=Acinetobacter kanungonis TaxID=2699469 RepID=UPI0013796F2C|nr:2-oxo-4-hydroxy-4-carboxy-5-ureidoimidazoline decarboxylase [Acinetobacter kanungonis]NCI78823.1 2-oxo-4-hydroxy-4-carboxy-5-ureidoimidazoline decarboxylase [Acinetobacter kanungonis]
MDLQQFNQLSRAQAQALLQPCVHIPNWIDALIQQRPFSTTDQLLHYAGEQAKRWSWTEIAEALAQHPRIGERKAAAKLSAKEQKFSTHEQSQLGADAALQQALYQGNLDYEHKFGHIFLIRAAGRTGQEMLSELQRRLGNTMQQEQQEVQQQLTEIAVLRLKQEIQ